MKTPDLKTEAETAVTKALDLIWHNLPDAPATFGTCAYACNRGKLGRGGGPCLYCARDNLAALVGEPTAARYVDLALSLQLLEAEIRQTAITAANL